jgi:hypothetical protein
VRKEVKLAVLGALFGGDPRGPLRGPVIATGPRPAVKYAVEAIGIFFLVFTIGAAVASHSALAPLAIGAALMVMIYAVAISRADTTTPRSLWPR